MPQGPAEELTKAEIRRLAEHGIAYPWHPRQSLRLLDELAERDAELSKWRSEWDRLCEAMRIGEARAERERDEARAARDQLAADLKRARGDAAQTAEGFACKWDRAAAQAERLGHPLLAAQGREKAIGAREIADTIRSLQPTRVDETKGPSK